VVNTLTTPSGLKGFGMKGKFTLASGSDGINPLAEKVVLSVGPYTATIPVGSFQQLRRGKKVGSYFFDGVINGVTLDILIVPLSENSYQVMAEASPVDLGRPSSQVPVSLTIGNDAGATSVMTRLN
jgi:hypothetical protein